MRKTQYPIFLLFILLFNPVFAQTPHPWEAGGGIGAGACAGDLQAQKAGIHGFDMHSALSGHLRLNLSNRLAARFGMLYTCLSGDDTKFETNAARAFSFHSSLFEMSLRGEIYPFGLYKEKSGKSEKLRQKRRAVMPFLSLGLGAAFFSQKNDWNETNDFGGVEAARVQADIIGRNNAALAIPMGAGCRFRITHRLTAGLEGVLRYTTSDYLDGISVAANPSVNDWFYTLQLTSSYAFGEARKNRGRTRKSSNADDEIPSADADNDGVSDDKDECPDTPGMRSFKGCPDTDHDGIADRNDTCPETPGLPSLNGCPDRDEDGITDASDNCPDVKGVEAYRGCPPVDRDKDGVADAEDLCPDMNGHLRWKGCPDSDSDGIPDNKDGCPGIPGPDHLRGCPDADEDGISDKDDECPTIPGLPEKKGCPDAPPAAPGVPYKAVYFGSTLEEWHVTSLITLDEIVMIMNADSSLLARIEGHTDNTGKEPANDLLAEKRAHKCRDFLVSKGVTAARLNYLGYGSSRPAVPNDTRQNRQLNRRVEVHFYRK